VVKLVRPSTAGQMMTPRTSEAKMWPARVGAFTASRRSAQAALIQSAKPYSAFQ
jgi:hypothetical protein